MLKYICRQKEKPHESGTVPAKGKTIGTRKPDAYEREFTIMTQATIGGIRYQMSKEMKAKLLTVFSINEAGHLACTSGSNPKDAYVVRHNGAHSTYCPCKSHGDCCHRIAVDEYLRKQCEMEAYRTLYPNDFDFAA